MKTVTDFFLLGFKITADGDCSHEIKRRLLFGRKDKSRQCIKKQRHHFADKDHIVKIKVFPVVMYRCESWTIKKAECQRIAVFKLCWGRLLRVSWNARRSNQLILKKINPEHHWKNWWWSWSSSTLATWCKELTHWRRPWCWERLKAGGEGNDREWDG